MERGERGTAVDPLLPVIRTDVWRFVPSCSRDCPAAASAALNDRDRDTPTGPNGSERTGGHDGAISIGRFSRRHADWRASLVAEFGDTLGG